MTACDRTILQRRNDLTWRRKNCAGDARQACAKEEGSHWEMVYCEREEEKHGIGGCSAFEGECCPKKRGGGGGGGSRMEERRIFNAEMAMNLKRGKGQNREKNKHGTAPEQLVERVRGKAAAYESGSQRGDASTEQRQNNIGGARGWQSSCI